MNEPAKSITVAVEGYTDIPVVARLASAAGLQIGATHVTNGKGNLDRRLPGFVSAGRQTAWFVLRDLDNDAPCAPEYLQRLNIAFPPLLIFRLAIRDMETWLLADRQVMASALSVSVMRIPEHPENEQSGKASLIGAASASNSARIRSDLLPRRGDARKVGPGYVSFIEDFASQKWDPDRAAPNSDSLSRALTRLRELGARLP